MRNYQDAKAGGAFMEAFSRAALKGFVLLAMYGIASAQIGATAPPKATTTERSARSAVELDIKALAKPLQDLMPAERQVVDEAIELIGQKRHALALLDLTRLTASNPNNSALRVLRAYVLLELGNITGALNDARSAEASGARSAYRCWFLAQVAYLAGNKPLCCREIKHLTSQPSPYGMAAEKLSHDLETGSK
jgi:predicted Zn-dependent protease